MNLVTQPLRCLTVLDNGLEDEGGHRGVDHIATDPALGQPLDLIVTPVPLVPHLRD